MGLKDRNHISEFGDQVNERSRGGRRSERSTAPETTTPAPVRTDRRVPRRNVRFPEAVTLVSPDQVMDTTAFLALSAAEVNEAEPALIRVDQDGSAEVQKAWKLPDGKVAIVVAFDSSLVRGGADGLNVAAAHMPMQSPNGKHVYVDPDQLEQAIRHGSFRNALRAAEFNAGYNPVFNPPAHPNDEFFNAGVRA